MTKKTALTQIVFAIVGVTISPALGAGNSHGGGGNSAGAGRSSGNSGGRAVAPSRSAAPTARANTGARSNSAASASRRQSTSAPHQTPRQNNSGGQRSFHFGGPRSTAAAHTSTVGRGSGNRVVVKNYYNYGGRSFASRIFWGRSWYYGGYPGIWYYGGEPDFAFGYRYTFGPSGTVSGIKFDLTDKDKANRKALHDANVYLVDEDGQEALLDPVGRHSESFDRALKLNVKGESETYNLVVHVGDGQDIRIRPLVRNGQVTHVALQLEHPEQPSVVAPENQ